MADDPIEEALRLARRYMIVLGAHLDRASENRDVAEVARAWVRAVHIERALRAALPAEAAAAAEAEVAQAAEAAAAAVEEAASGTPARDEAAEPPSRSGPTGPTGT